MKAKRVERTYLSRGKRFQGNEINVRASRVFVQRERTAATFNRFRPKQAEHAWNPNKSAFNRPLDSRLGVHSVCRNRQPATAICRDVISRFYLDSRNSFRKRRVGQRSKRLSCIDHWNGWAFHGNLTVSSGRFWIGKSRIYDWRKREIIFYHVHRC